MRVAIATGQTNRVTEATGLGICLSGFWEQNRKALFFVEKADRKRKIRGSVSWGGKNSPRLSSDVADNVKGELYNFGWSRRPARAIRPKNQIYALFNDAGRSSAARYTRLFLTAEFALTPP